MQDESEGEGRRGKGRRWGPDREMELGVCCIAHKKINN
jgi:hypothetical protein